jgi:hypothetical protein
VLREGMLRLSYWEQFEKSSSINTREFRRQGRTQPTNALLV